MRTTPLGRVLLTTLAGVLACDSGRITGDEQTDIVAAFRDPSTAFDAIATYALPDSVVHLTTDRAEETPAALTRELDGRILDRVRTHLDARGYAHEPEPDRNPTDVVVLVSAIATPNFASWTNYPWFDWWGFFPGFAFGDFDPSWGIHYSWSEDAVAFRYEVGTIVIEMVDARSIDAPNQQVDAIWSGAINGVLPAEGSAGEARVLRSIDEVFALSPYLGSAP